MSYDISLNCPKCGRCMDNLERFEDGGAYAIGGTTEAELNVTYNYAEHFNFRQLDKMTAKQALSILEEGVNRLGIERHSDYWESTPGNAGRAVDRLRQWAQQAIATDKGDYIFEVS